MYLYRYSSGQRRTNNKKPMLDVYFITPGLSSGYDNPRILTAMATIGPVGFPVSYLNNTGGDEVVHNELENCRWIAIDLTDVPQLLTHNRALQTDQRPHSSQWFRTEVPDDFLKVLEETVAELPPELRNRQPIKSARSSNQLAKLAITLAAIVAIVAYYKYT